MHHLCRIETGEVTETCPTLPEEEYEECELNILPTAWAQLKYTHFHSLSRHICRAQISERVSMMFPHHSLCLGELLQSGFLGFLSLLLFDWILTFWTPGQYLLTALFGKRVRHSENFTVFFIISMLNVSQKDISKCSHLVLNFKSLIGIICLHRAARCRKATLQRWL